MNVAITGGAGFLGRGIAGALLADPSIRRLTLVDVAPIGGHGGDGRLFTRQADLLDASEAAALVADADVIFHLAAVVSGQAEADFDAGMRVNIDATRGLLDAARRSGRQPRFVFASSLAVFGPPVPGVVTDETVVRPQSSYGIQKAIGELLVSDYSRRGFVDGRILRLPTVCVRPGRPNAAASSFVSSIIREPLRGIEAVCPVDAGQELWLSSPATAISNLVHGGSLPDGALGTNRIVNLPGITVAVEAMICALARLAGPAVAARVAFTREPVAQRIVSGWPTKFDVGRAVALGFRQDSGIEALIRQFMDERAA